MNLVNKEKAKQMFIDIGSKYHITLIEWNHDQDHVHVLSKAHPKTEPSKFINYYKIYSSRIINKNFLTSKSNCGRSPSGLEVFVF
ncbi:Transposase IS200 like [Seinonella peptonophila]|uniref:Transposase IS200 like n=1 Tax=Seinonella peptonophila TaxID=112248 RepID=A0A1M5B6W6_9BACL|nr:Transposase IS200 like [Seinonella peptonophila]